MIRNAFIACAAYMALLIGFAAGSSAVFAEPAADVLDKITVVEPRVNIERAHQGVSTIHKVRREARVELDDLDLTRTEDLRQLEDRVNEAAGRVCRELQDDLPFGKPETSLCIIDVINDALAQIEEVTPYATASAR